MECSVWEVNERRKMAVSYILHFRGICGECPCRSQVLSDNFLNETIKGTINDSIILNNTEITGTFKLTQLLHKCHTASSVTASHHQLPYNIIWPGIHKNTWIYKWKKKIRFSIVFIINLYCIHLKECILFGGYVKQILILKMLLLLLWMDGAKGKGVILYIY